MTDLGTSAGTTTDALWTGVVGRRAFLKGVGLAGATGGFLAAQADAASGLNAGDVAILRFLAAAEIIETDLWQQYEELGGEEGGNEAYMEALENIDDDMPQYISDNTDDEESHVEFLNAYLMSKGAPGVNLDRFRTLESSKATGAKQIGRLTNLKHLNVDTSFYTRYRSPDNPDFGATFPQAVNITNQPAIPLSDRDTPPGTDVPAPPVSRDARRIQAIASTAAFHFAMIEQGGSSLYTNMALHCSSLEVLRIVVSIGGVEVDHFSLWHDKVGATVSEELANLTDPVTGTFFPDLNALEDDLFDTELVLPEPCRFLRRDLPKCSVIRPSSTEKAGAVAAVRALTADGLFIGQSDAFFRTIMELAVKADAAKRTV